MPTQVAYKPAGDVKIYAAINNSKIKDDGQQSLRSRRKSEPEETTRSWN